MRRVNKRDILMLIILLILLIIMIRAFIGSRANNVLEVTVNFKDDKNLLGSETITMEAVNEGESGIAITLPSIVNTKYISKYIITEKDIIGNENKLTVDLMPGEKIYLTQEEVESLEVNLIVEYDTVEKDSQILYNKQLILKDEEEYELLSVSGYMPNDTQMEVQETDITSIENEILQKYPNSFVIGNYDIKLISNEKEYIAKDYEQKLNIHISIIDENSIYNVLEIKDDKIEELNDIVIESNKIKFTVEELRKFLIIQESEASVFAGENTEDSTEENTEENTENSQIVQSGGTTTYAVDKENIKFEIDDFESDKNYYLGLNYTEEMSKTNLGKYTETNLKEVTINYYGNNYDIVETNVRENFDITLNASATRTTTGNTEQSGNGNNRRYTRTDVITCTISGITALKTQYSEIQADSGWTMRIPVPSNNFATYFYANGTDTANSSNGISVSVSNQIMTVSGEDSSSLEGNDDTWTFTFSVSLSGNNRNTINNINYTNLTVNSFATTISAIRLTSSATISNTELHDLIVYKKCVPINSNGNVEIELIDNPFMNRPIGQGFNGWKTNDTRYANSISTNTNTFVQTINTSINNITDDEGNYVINLYPDWVQANVIFVSSSGNSNNSGTSPSSPVNNNWDNINSKINSNIKNCTNASNREVNIVVLMNGTLDIDGLTEANTPITLTSLYNGTNYGSTSTYLNVDNANIQADSDLQLHHLYVSSSKSYTSPSGTTDGTSAVTPCLYGNMYNVRIGRGVVPTNSNYCTWAQVQGGYYNRSSSEYKLIIESGQYYTVQLYRASGGNTSTTANATIVIGSDIERVINNNSTLKIYNRMASRTTSATATPYQSGRLVNMIIKSGTIGVDYFNNASTADNSNRNYAGIYVGGHGDTGYDKGDRYLVVEGGNIANIIGGLSMDEDDMHKTYMRVKDGNIINITGGAGYTHTYGDRIIQVTGGCVKYSISGGSNGVAASTTTNNGQLTGESLIYVGGTAQIGASYSIDENGNRVITETNTSETLYGVNSGCVCGGANGNSDYAGQTDASYIIIDGQAIVHNNVYGGGNYGVIGSEDATPEGAEVIEINNQTSRFAANTEYFITTSASGGNALSVSGTRLSNQTMSTAMIPSDSGKWIFESAGGSQYYLKNVTTGQYLYVNGVESSGFIIMTYTANLELSTTNKTAFTVEGTNTKTVTYTYTGGRRDVDLYLRYNNGWTMTNSTTNSSLYLLTYEKLPEQEVTEDVKTLVNIKVFGGNIKNNIYGGANQNNIYGTVDIDMTNGIVNGTVYGGSNILGAIFGSSLIDISGGQLGNSSVTDYTSVDTVFGGGLGQSTNVQGRVLLNIKDTSNNLNIYGNAYGGSSLGTITGDVEVNIQDNPSIANIISIYGYVFGGGKGDNTRAAVVAGDITVNVDGSDLPNCSVFGGSNINGTINGKIAVNVGKTYNSTIFGIYGGGNQDDINTVTPEVKVYLLPNANVTNAFNGGKAADLISAGENDTSRAIYLQGGTVQNIYGGSDSSGTVTVSNVYIESGNTTNVYGGNNQGGITQTTNVTINGGIVQDVYGGGNQAVTNVTNVYIYGNVSKNVFGGGNQAGINTNTNVTLIGATIGDNVYGGGNQGTVTQNTYVKVKNSILQNSLYAGGNGVSAVVYGNTNLIMEGINNVTNNVFGGGNQAATGIETNNNSTSTVNIVGATIGKNVYGGANTSVVYGTTQTNIGYDTVGDNSLEIGDIIIGGTVFGGGEANASGSEVYDFSFISVTRGIDIQIDGNKHNKFTIAGSIFGSGNASSTSGTSYINIQNYGTADNPQNNVSIQRANCATISNSAISLSGATDRTNEYSTVFFSLSRVDQVKLKNNSVLYLCNGANLLKNLDSLVDINGTEETAKVTINPDTGEVTERNVDNRIYMLESKNLNVATNEQATAYGQVHGMIFLGLFTNRMNASTSTGFYHKGYNNGDEITNAGTFSSNSYVMAQHMINHDITIDGFYTNYNENGIIKVDYIDTTPKDDVYYIWVVGEELDVTKFEVSLSASKYATLGTYELLLKGFSDPNLKFSLNGFSAGLANGISLVDPDEIQAIEPDDERANSVYGLTMKTGNIGWKTKGTTKFLTQNGGSYIGQNDYDKDNSSYTPTLNLCLYHAENITIKQALGDVRIRLQVLRPIDDLNYEISYIDIIITLSSQLYQNDFFEAAITPGQEYGLFTTTETTITSKSAFSTYYSLYVEDFSNSKYFNGYQTYKRVLVSRDINNSPYVFPENTKLTMLDMVTKKFYYYIVTANDVENNKYEYYLSDFIAMGSNDDGFDEFQACNDYYNAEKDLIYENFIFHINFADSTLENNIQNNSLLMELRDNEGETLVGVLGIQRDSMVYTVYKGEDATIQLEGNLSPETLYLGKSLNLNVITKFTQTVVDSKTVYDTQYFDQKLGIKISIYDKNGNHLNLDSLFGVNFEIDGKLYYPRVDGTTRINIADKVTEVLAKIKMNTAGNKTLATGDYTIEIESFGSPDGIYYGLTASDKIELKARIINSSYGLKVTNMDITKIIDKETAINENGSNTLVNVVKYSSQLENPNIAVSLYRRDYANEYSQDYILVDLQDYISDMLITTGREKEYVMSTTPMSTTTNYYTFKPNLITGTYKLVFKLYDGDTYVGEAFDYIIIK